MITDRQPADFCGRRQIPLEQQRRHREDVGNIVEPVTDVVRRKQRAAVDVVGEEPLSPCPSRRPSRRVEMCATPRSLFILDGRHDVTRLARFKPRLASRRVTLMEEQQLRAIRDMPIADDFNAVLHREHRSAPALFDGTVLPYRWKKSPEEFSRSARLLSARSSRGSSILPAR
jgi:hypothetical protein